MFVIIITHFANLPTICIKCFFKLRIKYACHNFVRKKLVTLCIVFFNDICIVHLSVFLPLSLCACVGKCFMSLSLGGMHWYLICKLVNLYSYLTFFFKFHKILSSPNVTTYSAHGRIAF